MENTGGYELTRSSGRGCGGGGGVSAEEWGRVPTKYWMHVIEMGRREEARIGK